MDKRTACHKLADLNEAVYDLENSLENIESRLCWDDESRREWYLERKEEVTARLEEARAEAQAFLREYYDIIHS